MHPLAKRLSQQRVQSLLPDLVIDRDHIHGAPQTPVETAPRCSFCWYKVREGKEAAAHIHARREARGLSGSLLRSELPRRVPLISCKRARKIYPAFFLACARYRQSSVGGALTRLSLGPPIQPWKKSLKDPNLAPSLPWDSSKIWRRPARPVVWRWGRPRLCRHCWDVREIRPGTTA